MILYIIGAIVAFLVIFFFATYKVIQPNEAHVVTVLGSGRKVITPVDTETKKGRTAYFFVPFFMQRVILPLTNTKVDINSVELNDKEVAPFVCDVNTWLYIADPVKAAERLDLKAKDIFASLHADLTAIVQAVARAASMNNEILDIMRDRKKFSQAVQSEVAPILLDKWGIELVNLEVNDIRDAENSTIIHDYEAMRQADISSKARIVVAEKNREAVEKEQENLRLGETAKAVAEKEYRTQYIEKDRVIGIREQEQAKDIAVAKQETNQQEVQAYRVMEVGKAQVIKEAAIETATGKGEAIRIEGEKDAEVVRLKGTADADIITLKGKADGEAIRAKGLAEAEAKEKFAVALQKYNDAATVIEKIHAAVEVEKARYEAYGKIGENAEFKMVSNGDDGSFFGLGGKAGASVGQFLEGLDMEKVQAALETVLPKKEDKKEETA